MREIKELKKEYIEIFEECFKAHYKNGYFGNINEETIKAIQYKWFATVVGLLGEKKYEDLVPFITNHNNKVTRDYYSKLTKLNIKTKSKEDILAIVNKSLWGKQ